jgi:GT2 family glycosyltransferase
MRQAEVSIIISVFEQLEYTKRCLEALENSLSDIIEYEVLIIDDCSEDGTVEFLKNLKHPYRTFFNSVKKGFAKNNNLAASQAKGQYLCFLNNDVFVEGDWLLPMINVFEEKEGVGVVGNVQRLAFSSSYDHMGVVFGPQGNPRHYGQWFKKRLFKGEVKKWSAVTAACCLVEKKAFRTLGCFDEIYINGCEDVDLCLRFNREGLSNYIVHDSVVLHVKGASEGRKIFKDQNSEILLKRWKSQIRLKEAVDDQILHAENYIYRGLFRPFSTNLWKWIEAVLIYFRLKRL